MKQVDLTIREYYLFKQIANFFFDVIIKKDVITIKADRCQLEMLGY
jgi:hypothetical protein